MNKKRSILLSFLFICFAISLWFLIFDLYKPILLLSHWADDWPLIWGVAQQKSLFFDPGKVNWVYEYLRFAIREGYLQIWYTSLLYKIVGFNPYWYHFSGIILQFIASLAVTLTTWHLTKRFLIGIFAGIIFSTIYVGSYSLFWFNVNASYLFIPILLLTIIVFIKGMQGSKKNFIFSLLLIAFCVYLYPPRVHALLALPLLGLVWTKKIFTKQTFIKILLSLCVFIFASRLFFGENGSIQAYNAFGRVYAFGTAPYEQGDRMFLTFPFIVAPITMLPQRIIEEASHYPYTLNNSNLLITNFEIWNFILFPFTWVLLVFCLQKMSQNNNKKSFIFWISISIFWAIINTFLKKYFFIIGWDFKTHLLFITSGYLFFISLAAHLYFKNDDKIIHLPKILISSLLLLFFSYFFSWAFDPLIFPNTPSGGFSRYVTTASVFGTIFFVTLFAFFYSLIRTKYISRLIKKQIKGIYIYVLLLRYFFLILFIQFIYTTVSYNIMDVKYEINTQQVPVFSYKNQQSILQTISEDIPITKVPTVILIDPWEYSNVFGTLMFGYAPAVWNKMYDTTKIPILYYDEKSLTQEFPVICKKYKITTEHVYRFIVEKNRAINISEKLPNLSCKG